MSDVPMSPKHEAVLKAIEKRLAELPVDVVVEQLHACSGGGGPTVDEFIESFDLPGGNPDYLEDPVVANDADRLAAKRFLACLAGEQEWAPPAKRLERLRKLGWLELRPNGAWAVTPSAPR